MLRLAIPLLFAVSSLRAERALLECTANAPGEVVSLARRAVTRLEFRTALVEGWSVSRATLLLHLAGGEAPREVDVAVAGGGFRRSATRQAAGGWIEIELDRALLKDVAKPLLVRARPGLRFHTRQTIQFSPYLIVEGSAPR